MLFKLLHRNIKDKLVLNTFHNLLFYDNEKTGIPIGNLCSQLFANLYLNKLDYFVKHELKAKIICVICMIFYLFMSQDNSFICGEIF